MTKLTSRVGHRPIFRSTTILPSREMSPYSRHLTNERFAGRVADFLSLFSPRSRQASEVNPQRIGVLAQWGIGDAVLLLPLLRGLKQACPHASLELIGKPWLSDLFAGEGFCDRTHTLVPPWTSYTSKYRILSKPWWVFITQTAEVRRHNFDWLISVRFDLREILQLRLLRARETFGFAAAGGRRWVSRDFELDRAAYDLLHRDTLSAKALKAIVPTALSHPTRFQVQPAAQERARQWLWLNGYRGGPVLVVHSGAGNPLRRWREQRFDSVIKALVIAPAFIVFIEEQHPSPTSDWLTTPHSVWRGGLADLKALLSVCHVFLGTDSGVMHMAAASGCKVVAAFGPGEPRWFRPSGEGHEIGIVEPMRCRPCRDACIHTRPLCFDQLADAVLSSAVDRKLVEARDFARASNLPRWH